MITKLLLLGMIVSLCLTIYAGYYFATKQECIHVPEHQSLGHVVLTIEESEELYDLSQPILVPMNKISDVLCREKYRWFGK